MALSQAPDSSGPSLPKRVLVDLPVKYEHLAPGYWEKKQDQSLLFYVWAVRLSVQQRASTARSTLYAATASLHRKVFQFQLAHAASLGAISLLESIETEVFARWATPNGAG